MSDDLRSQPAAGVQPAVDADTDTAVDADSGGALSGDELRRAFGGALAWLEEHRDTVNALNVFPVPDGDTGTNMLLTLRRATEQGPHDPGGPAAEAAHSLAQGAFLGARGNSGVILSQFFKGFAVALEGRTDCSGAALAEALSQAKEAAYRAVSQPVEGTMLTVIREAAEAAQASAAENGQSPAAVLSAAFAASRQSLLRTPELLPVLREAGVVDSGGLGIVVILGGLLAGLTAGDDAAPETPPGSAPGSADEHPILSLVDSSLAAVAGGGLSISSEYLHTTLDTDWGYCTEFIISGQELNPDRVRAHYEQTAQSTVVVGDGRQVRVHLHAEDPGPALSYAVGLGTLSSVKIESMDDQNVDFAAAHSGYAHSDGAMADGLAAYAAMDAPAPTVDLAVTAVVSGEALARLFRELGCAAPLPGGQTMNPSVQQLLDAAGRSGGRAVIILPNNKNIIATAQQAAAVNPALRVVPSRSLPQGIAALLAYNPEHSLAENLAAMTAALDGVASIEVTRSVRDTSIGGVAVAAGDYIALLDDALLSAHDTAEAALRAGLDAAGLRSDSIVTVYRGADADAAAAGECAAALERAHPGIQVDLVDGGQPHYQYLASVE